MSAANVYLNMCFVPSHTQLIITPIITCNPWRSMMWWISLCKHPVWKCEKSITIVFKCRIFLLLDLLVVAAKWAAGVALKPLPGPQNLSWALGMTFFYIFFSMITCKRLLFVRLLACYTWCRSNECCVIREHAIQDQNINGLTIMAEDWISFFFLYLVRLLCSLRVFECVNVWVCVTPAFSRQVWECEVIASHTLVWF